MNITQVHYQKPVSLGNYENERIGAWAMVEDGETPEGALETLIAWVEERGATRASQEDEIVRGHAAIEAHRRDKARLEREVEQMRAVWERGKTFLERLGLPVPAAYRPLDDEMPF